MRQMLKEMQQAGQVDGEAGHKAAFPRGSRCSIPDSAAGREMMPRTGRGDEGAGKASPSAWMNNVLKPLEPPADVSTGRTSPALTLDAALKPSSHHRGTPTGKIQDRTDKISLESPKEMRQELKELLQTRQEMDIVLQWKLAFLEGSTPSSMPAPAAGRKAMADTGTGTADWDAGKNSPLAWRSEVVKPSGHSADVSAGTPSTTPTLDAAQKPSSHGRGPPPEEIKDMAGKKFQNPLEITWQMLKEVLQGGQGHAHPEIPCDFAVSRLITYGGCFDESGPCATQDVYVFEKNCLLKMPPLQWGSVVPDELLFFLSPQVDGEAARKAAFPEGSNRDGKLHYLDALLDDGLRLLKNAGVVPVQISRDGRSFCGCCVTGVSAGRTFPGPLVDVARKPSSHRKGPPRGKNKATGHKKPHEPLKITGQMVKELLQAEQEVDAEAGQKAAFPEGSSGSVPASAVGLEAMPGTGTGGWDQDMDYLENLLDYGLRLMGNPGAEPAGEGGAASQATSRTEPLGDAEGVSAGRTSPAPLLIPTEKPGNHRRGPPPEEIKDMADKKFQNPLEIMWQMLKEVLQGGQEMKGEPVEKEAFPGGSRGFVATSAAGREAMPGTDTGDWNRDMGFQEVLMKDGLKFLEDAGGKFSFCLS
ncbi:uncharacterized protein LOC135291696 [Passer domesticus]|uniref:uncharacterized protein LOC135291696 n=1 Tax=Passer domesticus TaxID=48849 RepID=UPI0030FED103